MAILIRQATDGKGTSRLERQRPAKSRKPIGNESTRCPDEKGQATLILILHHFIFDLLVVYMKFSMIYVIQLVIINLICRTRY